MDCSLKRASSTAYVNLTNKEDFKFPSDISGDYLAVIDRRSWDEFYQDFVGNVEHLLQTPALAATLFVRLSNKFRNQLDIEEEDEVDFDYQYLHCAHIAYRIIMRSTSISFNDILSYLLSFMGVININ